jgi:hypothetical protein
VLSINLYNLIWLEPSKHFAAAGIACRGYPVMMDDIMP